MERLRRRSPAFWGLQSGWEQGQAGASQCGTDPHAGGGAPSLWCLNRELPGGGVGALVGVGW